MKAIELLVDSRHGQYIPQVMANAYGHGLKDVGKETIDILKAGPDHEHYIEAWLEVLDNAYFTQDGDTYHLHQTENGDLFALCRDRLTWQEACEFYGEEEEAECYVRLRNIPPQERFDLVCKEVMNYMMEYKGWLLVAKLDRHIHLKKGFNDCVVTGNVETERTEVVLIIPKANYTVSLRLRLMEAWTAWDMKQALFEMLDNGLELMPSA